MINTAYLHEYAPTDQFLYESHFIIQDMADYFQKLNAIDLHIKECEYFGERVDDDIYYLEKESKNIFTKIGDMIIGLFTSFFKGISNLASSIKDSITGTKKVAEKAVNDEAIQKAWESNPEMADEFLRAVAAGNITTHDVKDINELVEMATQITDQLAAGKIGLEDWKTKLKKGLDGFAALAVPLTAIVGFVNAINTFRDNKTQRKDREEERKDRAQKRKDSAEKMQWDREDRKERKDRESKTEVIKTHTETDSKTGVVTKRTQRTYESTSDVMHTGFFFNESVKLSFGSLVNKLTSFISSHMHFCNTAVSKMKSLQDRVITTLKEKTSSKPGEENKKPDQALISTITSGLQQVMSAIMKEENTINVLSGKLNKKLAKMAKEPEEG